MQKDKNVMVSDAGNASDNIRKELIKKTVTLCITLTMATLAVVAYLSRAWFANNREVKGEGMRIMANGDGYELAVKGEEGKWDEIIASSVHLGTVQEASGENYHVTDQNRIIRWMMNDTSNFGNQQENNGKGINPGAHGSLTFYILAKKTGSISVTFDLQIEGLTEDRSAATAEGNKMVQSHILLFAGFDSANNAYSNWISLDAGTWSVNLDGADLSRGEDGSLTWTGEVVDGRIYPVTIYWTWPEVLGQYIFQDHQYIGDRPVLFPEELPDGLFEKMCTTSDAETSNGYFRWANDSAQTGLDKFRELVTPDTLNGMRDGTGYNTITYGNLCTYYNAADQYIGETVRYLILRLDTK